MSRTAISPVIQAYRTLGTLIRRLPKQQQRQAKQQLRNEFRKHVNAEESNIPALLEVANKKIAFLRIITPKDKSRDGEQKGTSNFIYDKNGELDENGVPKMQLKARHTNWDGNNMDPCSVKRHFNGLKRMGFRNNDHAKGMF